MWSVLARLRVMALIEGFEKSGNEAQRVHGTVRCGYRSFTIEGKTLIQLDTYGSDEREIPGKISQSLQLDEQGAEELIAILREAFPGLK
jgi:hypothetical protein